MKEFDSRLLAQALEQRRQELGPTTTWKEVAAQAGVPESSLTRLRKQGMSRRPVLVRLLEWLEQTDLGPYLVDVPAGDDGSEGGVSDHE